MAENDQSAQPGDDRLTRRQFLSRTAKAGAVIGSASAIAWALRDTVGPGPGGKARTVTLPDYSIRDAGPRLAIFTGADRRLTARRAVQALGGMERFIRPGDRVVLKVNAAFATPAMLGATTHPDLVAEVTQMCRLAGAASVIVTDNPINNPPSCFAISGIGPAAVAAGAELNLPREELFANTTLPGGRLIVNWPLLYGPLKGATKLIGIAPVKDHHRSGASMTLKNWYGLLGGRRNVFHQDIHAIITELALLVRPTLVFLDGTTSMMTNGPTGGSLEDLAQTNTMIVSTDGVAADATGAALLGKTPADLPFITMAADAGAGTVDVQSLNPIRGDIS